MCRSDPHTPVASTRTTASSGSIGSGSGRSSTLTTPGAWKVTARMGAEAYLQRLGEDDQRTGRPRTRSRPGPPAPVTAASSLLALGPVAHVGKIARVVARHVLPQHRHEFPVVHPDAGRGFDVHFVRLVEQFLTLRFLAGEGDLFHQLVRGRQADVRVVELVVGRAL